MKNNLGTKYAKETDIKDLLKREIEGSAQKNDPNNPYKDLTPPKEGPMKKVFVWDPVKQEYNLGSYQKSDSILEFDEIKEVFKAIKPYAQQVLTEPKLNLCKKNSLIDSLHPDRLGCSLHRVACALHSQKRDGT